MDNINKDEVKEYHSNCDDSDIKIATAITKRTVDEGDVRKEFVKHKENGNIDRSNELGKRLVEIFDNSDKFSCFGVDECESDEVLTQRNILLTFTAIYVVENSIFDKFISECVRAAFWKSLEEQYNDIYQFANKDLAYSMYYLCSRTASTMADCVGETFSKLCNKLAEADIYSKYGKTLFLYYVNEINKIVNSYEFE